MHAFAIWARLGVGRNGFRLADNKSFIILTHKIRCPGKLRFSATTLRSSSAGPPPVCIPSCRSFVCGLALYLAALQKSLAAPVFLHPLLSASLTLAQTMQIFDVIFALAGATKTNTLQSAIQVYSRLFVLYGSLYRFPTVSSS